MGGGDKLVGDGRLWCLGVGDLAGKKEKRRWGSGVD